VNNHASRLRMALVVQKHAFSLALSLCKHASFDVGIKKHGVAACGIGTKRARAIDHRDGLRDVRATIKWNAHPRMREGEEFGWFGHLSRDQKAQVSNRCVPLAPLEGLESDLASRFLLR
jgi:hypothetical protein